MQNQLMQLDKKQFQELLKEIKLYNKLDLVAQTFQTKYAMETAGEDDEQRKKDAKRTNELLEQIAISVSGGKDTKNKASITKIGSTRKKSNKEDEDGYRTLGDVKNNIKDDLKEFKREIKTGVAFGKRVGGGIKEAVTSPIQTMKKIGSKIAGFGKSAFGQTKDILSTPSDYKNPTMAALQQPLSKEKIDNPNIVNEPDEILAQEAENQSVTFKELLDVTKESLDQLKAIRGTLEGTPTTGSAQPTSKTPKTAPVAAAPAAAEEGGGSMIGDAIGGKVMAGVGGKVLGGLKAGGAMLGKGVLAAGKFIGGAALAKPALIAAGVGLAAYGAYKGYKALTKKDDGAASGAAPGVDPELEKAKESKEAKALQQLASEGKYTFSSEGKTVNVINKETGELVQTIKAPGFISGKELIEVAGVGGGTAGAQKPEAKPETKGEVKGKDGASREMSVDELKAQRQKIADQGPRTKNIQSQQTHEQRLELMDTAIADKERKQAAIDPTGMGDDKDYKPVDTGSLRQGQQGLKAQHDQFMKDTKPGSGYKEEPVAPKKTVGQRIAGLFGFGDKKQEPTLKEKSTAAAARADSAAFMAGGRETAPDGSASPEMRTYMQAEQESRIADDQLRKQQDEAARSGKMGLKAQHEQLMKDTKPGSGYKEEPVAPKKTIGQKVAGFLGFGKKDEAPKIEEMSSPEAKMVKGEPPTTAAAAAPVDRSKMHPMARRQLEDLEKYNKRNQEEHKAELAAAKKPPEPVSQASTENATMKDEMAAGKNQSTPIVMNNVSNNNQTTYVPIKGEPRPGSRGSALDRYNDRIANF